MKAPKLPATGQIVRVRVTRAAAYKLHACTLQTGRTHGQMLSEMVMSYRLTVKGITNARNE